MSTATGGFALPIGRLEAIAGFPAGAACSADVLDGSDLSARWEAQWDRLLRTAIEPNAFLSRQVVEAHHAAFGGTDTQFIAVTLRESGQLIGLFPMQPRSIAGVLPGIQRGSTINLYHVAGAPLIDSRHPEAALGAFLDLIVEDKDVPQYWAFPHTRADGRFAAALESVARHKGFTTRFASAYARPVLRRLDGGFAAHVDAVIGKKRKKDIERNWRRLSGLGELAFERAEDADTVAKRVEQFLEMEHAGWKGRAGTSFLATPEDAVYARAAFAPEGRAGATVADSLLLDGLPIAISINLRSGRTWFTPKCAFDEAYRKFGPGLVLEYKVIESFYENSEIEEMDAATTAGGHVISSFWNGSVAMGTVVLGRNEAFTAMTAALEDVEYRARQQVKALLGR